MISGWVSFLAYPNIFGIKGFVVVVVVVVVHMVVYDTRLPTYHDSFDS
jgi:hypothetical protein